MFRAISVIVCSLVLLHSAAALGLSNDVLEDQDDLGLRAEDETLSGLLNLLEERGIKKAEKIEELDEVCLTTSRSPGCLRFRCFYSFDKWTTNALPDVSNVEVMVFFRPKSARIRVNNSKNKAILKQFLKYDTSGTDKISSASMSFLGQRYRLAMDIAEEKIEKVCFQRVIKD